MKAYYGSRISENMTRTPEGFLICMNVPIARTGTQQYMRSELGILDGNPSEIMDVMRDEQEVFDPATIASFEGKPVTDEHPPDNLNPENISAFDNGHAQNVRRGVGQESDLLLADLFITSQKLIEAIEQGRREVSCGYDCQYEEIEGRLYQRAIRGNHVAVVPAGRAGARVAIKDSAQEQIQERRKKTMASSLKTPHSLFAKLFSRAVRDMEPDDVADAIDELTNAQAGATDDEAHAAPPPAPASDQNAVTLEGLAAAVAALTKKIDAMSASHDQEPAPQPAPVEEDPLQKLADDLAAAAQGAAPVDEEAATTIPADEMPEGAVDEDGPAAAANTKPENPIPGADQAIALGALNAIKPVIATLPKEQRKAASDAAAAEIRKLIGKDAKPKTDGYSAINQVIRQASKAKDSVPVDQGEIGRRIMENRNPHTKK